MRIHSALIVQPARCFVADVISVHHRIAGLLNPGSA